MQVSADLFPLLGIGPELGRVFTHEEDRPGQDNVIVLSHDFWIRRFAGDTNIVGRTVRLDGQQVTVIGVMPESRATDFTFGVVQSSRTDSTVL
jgi:hypothetical protein